MFKVGDRVICIDDDFTKVKLSPFQINFPKKNKKYTIREIYKSASQPGVVGLLLEEIKNPINNSCKQEYGFNIDRFRKLDTIKESKKWSNNLIKQLEKEFNKVEEEICINNQYLPHHDISSKNKSILLIRKNGLRSISSTH